MKDAVHDARVVALYCGLKFEIERRNGESIIFWSCACRPPIRTALSWRHSHLPAWRQLVRPAFHPKQVSWQICSRAVSCGRFKGPSDRDSVTDHGDQAGPGRQSELPAGFFTAIPKRNRLAAFRKRIFGGFEDRPEAVLDENLASVLAAL